MTADAVGGIWTYAIDLADALRASGLEVTLAVIGPGLDDLKRWDAEQAGCLIVDLGHPPEWLAAGPEQVACGSAALAALARERQADLVHLNHPALGADATFHCPVLAVCHSCVSTWWAAVHGTPMPHQLAWQADVIGAGYHRASALVAPSHAFALATQQAYGLAAAPRVVFNGRSAAPVGSNSTPAAFGLTVGRLWDEGKDLATLDRAAALTSVPIVAVGPTTGPNGAAVNLHHLETRGSMSDLEVRGILAQRPVFVSAARYEPFGLSALEAAQMGCALVLSDIPTFREIWGEAALFVAPGDAAGFAAALDRLVHEPALRARLGAAALDRSVVFDVPTAVEHLLGIYATILGGDASMVTGERDSAAGKAA